MKAAYFGLIGAILLVSSCMTYRLTPLTDYETSVTLNRGIPMASAVKDEIGVAVSAEVKRNLIYFKVYVKNFRQDLIRVDDSSASLVENGSNSLKVYGADEYYKQRQGQIITGEVLMVLSAALSAANAGYSRSTTYGNYSYSRNNYYRVYGTYSATTYTYDSAAAAMQRDVAFSNVNQYINGGTAELEFLKNALFYPSDVEANGDYYGIIVAELGEVTASAMDFSITLGGSKFRFKFNKEEVSYEN